MSICFAFLGGKKETLSNQLEDTENRIAEEPTDEYININELEGENVVEENITNNKTNITQNNITVDNSTNTINTNVMVNQQI